MEMNEAGQNCEEKADRQVIKKAEQRCVNDSDRRRHCDRVLQKASSHSLIDPVGIGILPAESTRHRGALNICDAGKFFHPAQDSREVVFIVVRQFF